MKRSEDTFTLTSVIDKNPSKIKFSKDVKFPRLGSSGNLYSRTTRPSTMATAKNVTSRAGFYKSSTPKNENTSSATYELLANIQQRAKQEVSNLITERKTDLTKTIHKIEKSKYVREIIMDLEENVLAKKKKYNNLNHKRKDLEKELHFKEQKYSDLCHIEKVEAEQKRRVESLKSRLEQLHESIESEAFYTEVLNHMLKIRQKNLDSIADPARALRSQILYTELKVNTLDRESEYQWSNTKQLKDELLRLQSELSLQRNEMREKINGELERFEDRSKAVEFYKESQKIWYVNREIEQKNSDIKDLQELDQTVGVQEQLEKKLESIQKAVQEIEVGVSYAVNSTKTQSLEDLATQFIKQKETRESLVSLRHDLESTLKRKEQEILALNENYDKLLIEPEKPHDLDNHALFDLENTLSKQETNLELNLESLVKSRENLSAAILALNRLYQKTAEEFGEETQPKSLNQVVEYLLHKIDTY